MAQIQKKHSVIITFVGDEDVMGHIVDIHKRTEGLKKTRKRTRKKPEETVTDVMKKNLKRQEKAEAVEAIEVEDVKHATSLFEDNEEIPGSDVFIFHTPKPKGQLKNKALEALRLSKERKSDGAAKIKNRKTVSSETTPKLLQVKGKNKRDSNHEVEKKSVTRSEKTPYSLRQKIKQRLVQVIREETSSSDESSNEEDASTDEDNEEVNFEENDQKNVIYNGEDFFTRHDDIITSNHTLARLDSARLDQSYYLNLIDNIPKTHSSEINNLLKNSKLLYRKWMLFMSEGFNVLLHGLGSKRELLCDFREKMLEDFHSILINGFSSSLKIKEILSSIIEEVLETQCITQNVQDQINFIKNTEVDEEDSIYLIIHNIDGVMLRSETIQNYLSQLAAIPWIHVIASIDHINAPIMWDQIKSSRFNWVWFDVTTFKQYKDEVVFEDSLLVQPSSGLMLRSLIHVYRSLNPKAKEIFQLIVRYQLDHKDNQSYPGLSYQDCYRKCREGFLVTSDLTLKAQLTEFKDHKLIKMKKGPDGGEYLIIPLDSSSLSEFIEHHL